MNGRAYNFQVTTTTAASNSLQQERPTAQAPAISRRERIRAGLQQITATFLSLGEELAQAYRARDWETLGLSDFGAYCASFNLSDSLCYDLIRIADMARSFPAQQAKMITAGVSNLRLILPQIGEDATAAQVETLVEMANDHGWRELRVALAQSEGDAPPDYPTLTCPHCRKSFEVTRATSIHRG